MEISLVLKCQKRNTISLYANYFQILHFVNYVNTLHVRSKLTEKSN